MATPSRPIAAAKPAPKPVARPAPKPVARPAPKPVAQSRPAVMPRPQIQPRPQVSRPPVAPPSLMDRPMGPGGGATPGLQVNVQPGMGGGGLQGIGPRAPEPSFDQLRNMQMEMGRQAELQQKNALSQIPAFAQMQALQGQLQGRQPNPQELQQLQMYDQQIQSNPGFQKLQGNLQQMGQQFEQQYGSQLQKMQQFNQQPMQQLGGPQQAQYAGPMGPGSAGPGAMPPPSMDMMYRPEVMPNVSPQQRQQREMEMSLLQQMATQQPQPFNQQPMQQAQPLGPQQGMLQGFQQQPPVQPPQSFGPQFSATLGQPQQAQQFSATMGQPQQAQQFSATMGQPQQAQQFSRTMGPAQPTQVGGQQAQQMGLGAPQQAQPTRPAGGGGVL